MSQKQRLLNILLEGNQLTAKQIQNRIGARNPRELVRQLREDGYAIYRNERRNSKGEVKGFYRLGTPTRSMVAAYYRVFGAN